MKTDYVLITTPEEYEGYKKGVESAITSQYGLSDKERNFVWGYEPEAYPCLVLSKIEKSEEWSWYATDNLFLYETDIHRLMGLFLNSKKKKVDKEIEVV